MTDFRTAQKESNEPEKITTQPGVSKPLSEEERKSLLERVRGNLGRSILEVKGPAVMYRYWARRPLSAEDMQEWSRLESLGFRIVMEDPKALRYQAYGLREDGTYVIGDVILTEVPREVSDFLFAEQKKTSLNLVGSAKETFHQEAGRAGVPSFEPNRKE